MSSLLSPCFNALQYKVPISLHLSLDLKGRVYTHLSDDFDFTVVALFVLFRLNGEY